MKNLWLVIIVAVAEIIEVIISVVLVIVIFRRRDFTFSDSLPETAT